MSKLEQDHFERAKLIENCVSMAEWYRKAMYAQAIKTLEQANEDNYLRPVGYTAKRGPKQADKIKHAALRKRIAEGHFFRHDE